MATKLKLPRAIRYRHHAVKIIRQTDDDKCTGYWNRQDREIYVEPGLPAHEEPVTFLHEIVHMVISDSGIRQDFTGPQEERVAEVISVGLAEVLTRNPALIKWLTKRLLDKPKKRRKKS